MSKRNYTEIGILVQENPAEAARRIKASLIETRGNASEAARRLGVAYVSLVRYFRRLRDAGHPVREEGKRGRSGHEDVEDFPARSKAVREAMRGVDLTERQAGVLRLRFPARGVPQTCAEIARSLGISRQAVQRAEARALARIRQASS